MMPAWVGLTLLGLASWGLTDLAVRAWHRVTRPDPVTVQFEESIERLNRLMVRVEFVRSADAAAYLWQLFQATKREVAGG